MYHWLPGAVADNGTVVTANRRLARVLQQEYAARQVAEGVLAWRPPAIKAWPDWLDTLLEEAAGQESLPTRINHHHSMLLWDRCLRKELDGEVVGATNLVRLARDAWQRLADWDIGIREIARHAQSRDHKAFAAAAGRYAALLDGRNWVDEAGLASRVCQLLGAGRIRVSGRYTFAGFDRSKPIVDRVRQFLLDQGCVIDVAPPRAATTSQLHAYDNADAELRAAGAWARDRLEEGPGKRIGIVVNGLERDAERMAGLVREGLIPGYRLSQELPASALNVSFGRRLAAYPAVSTAILWLRWLTRELGANDVCHLLRSPLIGVGPIEGRARLELRVRGMPDRKWSAAMVTAALRGKEEAPDAADWLQRAAALTHARRSMPETASPADWAIRFNDALRAAGWPGVETLDSGDFQLINRWRDLLNDLARMDLVCPRMSIDAALNQLDSMATEAVFQPEADITQVHLLGPLEASGLEFDALWLAGVTTAEWPAHGNPSVLVSRRLQEQNGMPDAVPDDTVEYARNLLAHLCAAAPEVVCSYPRSVDDAEQLPSALLATCEHALGEGPADPGWHAAKLFCDVDIVVVDDRVPAIRTAERLTGGAATLQNQLTDPATAFIGGRLGVRTLDVQASGLAPLLRGNLVHDALYQLYFERPSRDQVAAWKDSDDRISSAVDFAFSKHERQADDVLRSLLALERSRVGGLLGEFLAIDVERGRFQVVDVERKVELAESGVGIELRIDRVDRLEDGRLVIIDYKTGAEKKLLDSTGAPREVQLVAYACAIEEPVAALALANVDSRVVGFQGAGEGFRALDDWDGQLAAWKDLVREACHRIAAGDVRINKRQSIEEARSLNLLTRFTELRNEW